MKCPFLPINTWKLKKAGPYKILLADSICKKAQGLQRVPRLPDNTLMLFPQVAPGIYFHTLNCLFKMDICAISKYGQILDIFTAAPETTQIGPMPEGTAKVLEAPAYWFSQVGYKKGDYFPFMA